jgi:L(+)-tartrate dehydratase beta subunit
MERSPAPDGGSGCGSSWQGGSGGLAEPSAAGAYLAIIGGTAALETTWIEAIEDVDLDDLHPESI